MVHALVTQIWDTAGQERFHSLGETLDGDAAAAGAADKRITTHI
jgi:GTPase SAR1 family protein